VQASLPRSLCHQMAQGQQAKSADDEASSSCAICLYYLRP
jgi:hypothetical protein